MLVGDYFLDMCQAWFRIPSSKAPKHIGLHWVFSLLIAWDHSSMRCVFDPRFHSLGWNVDKEGIDGSGWEALHRFLLCGKIFFMAHFI